MLREDMTRSVSRRAANQLNVVRPFMVGSRHERQAKRRYKDRQSEFAVNLVVARFVAARN